ncbi:MAG: flagellar biosynthetic protein FliQ [Neomegalonema sp.]|nr:flagellar biosynthetic protein FliQ [Neomegalonema sp.]
MLTDAALFDILKEALWTAVVVSAPILAAALIFGLVIGLFQALTSIQEMTLTFVPKTAAMGVVFWLSMSFMGQELVSFFQDIIIPLIAGKA